MFTFIALVIDERADTSAPAPRRMVAAGRLGPGVATVVATAEVVEDCDMSLSPESSRRVS